MQVKKALWAGGIQRSNKPPQKMNTPGLQQWEDLVSSASLCYIVYQPTSSNVLRSKCISVLACVITVVVMTVMHTD